MILDLVNSASKMHHKSTDYLELVCKQLPINKNRVA